VINWSSVYVTSWAALFGALIVSFYPSSKKAGQMFDTYVEKIESHNADMGLNRSVSETDLVLDYLLPHREDRLERYSQNNGIKKDDYVDSLDEEVGKPTRLIAFVCLLVLTLLVGFSGPVIYLSTGLTYIGEYMIFFSFIIMVNIVGYTL